MKMFWRNFLFMCLIIAFGSGCQIGNGSSLLTKTLDAPYAGYWINGTWETLPDSISSYNYSVTAIVTDASGNVYAGGYCNSSSNRGCAGYWRNGQWIPLSNGVDSSNSNGCFVSAVAVDALNNVYAGGYCNSSSNIKSAGYWKNGIWTTLPNGVDSVNFRGCGVTAFVVDASGSVYAGGYSMDNSNVVYAGYWKNGTWTILPNGVDSTNTDGCMVESLALDVSGNVYACGKCNNSLNIPSAGYWMNGVWTTLSNGIDSSNSNGCCGNSLVIDVSGNIYIGGYCTTGSNIESAGYWKNGVWTTLTNGSNADNSRGCMVNTIVVDVAGNVYAGGYCTISSYIHSAGYWKNGEWISLPNGIDETNSNGCSCNALIVDSLGNVYAGGSCNGLGNGDDDGDC